VAGGGGGLCGVRFQTWGVLWVGGVGGLEWGGGVVRVRAEGLVAFAVLGGVEVVRGPTANIYGSGAIGGVVSFRTKDITDVVRPGERWGVDLTGSGGTNSARGLGSIFGGVRADPNVDV